MTIFWVTMVPMAWYFGWIYSVAFIAGASIYANAVSHLSAWRSDVPTEKDER